MARLLTCGFETGDARSEMWPGTAQPSHLAGTPTYDTAVVRSGVYSLKLDNTATAKQVRFSLPAVTNDRPYYHRVAVRFAAFPSSGTPNLISRPSGGIIQVNSSGQLRLMANTTLIGTSSALSLNTWYVISLQHRVNTAGNDVFEAKIDGNAAFATDSGSDRTSTNSTNLDLGSSVVNGMIVYMDDIALNDDQGASENSYPAVAAKQVLLHPAADSAVGLGWEAPQTTGSDTTNIYQSLQPTPDGVAHSDIDANNLKYIFDAANSQTDYDATLETYTAAGIGGSDTISLVMPLAHTGSSSATDTAGALDLLSNPDQGAETAFAAFDNGVAGTAPTNWRTVVGPPIYAPTVTKGTAPVLRVGKRTTTTRVAMVDILGLYVEYVPVATTPVDGPALALVWDTKAAVDGASQELIWNLIAEVNGASQELIWDLRAAVDGASQELIWDLRATADGAPQELIWDMRAAVDGAPQELIWNLMAAVDGAVLDLLWNLNAAVDGDPLELIWDLFAEGAVDGPVLNLVWDTKAEVNADPLELVWDLLAAVLTPVDGSELRLVWALRVDPAAPTPITVYLDPERMPVGVEVSAYLDRVVREWAQRAEESPPPGDPVETQTMSASGMTFQGLERNTDYLFVAQITRRIATRRPMMPFEERTEWITVGYRT